MRSTASPDPNVLELLLPAPFKQHGRAFGLSAVALLHLATKPVRRFDVLKKQLVMQREMGPQSMVCSAPFLVAFAGISAWICWR
jgi:hypothetical protein